MAEYWDKCEKARSVADKFAVESIKKGVSAKVWEKVINELAAKMLGVGSPDQLWEPVVLRPIALGAPEYQSLRRYPAILDYVGWSREGYSKRLYLLLHGQAILMNGYGTAPFYLISERITNIQRLTSDSFFIPRLREAGEEAGLLYAPLRYNEQRAFSFALSYFMMFFTTYKSNRGYITPAPELQGRRNEFIELSMKPSGHDITRAVYRPEEYIEVRLQDEVMSFARMIYTPCEVYDGLDLLHFEFKPLIYELDEYGGLAVVDQYSLQNVLKRGGTEIEAIIIEANKSHKAEENAQLLVVYPMTLKVDTLSGDPLTFKDLDSPSSLYDAAVLARLG